jgi:DNA-binding NarL/FixJ family response regulator
MAVRCLLVDDNGWFLRCAREHLERDGIEVTGVAMTSAEAVRRAEELRPDVVLIDVMLGDESGFDLANQIARASLDPPCMIMISAYGESEFAELLENGPAIGFLSKMALSGEAIRTLMKNARRLSGDLGDLAERPVLADALLAHRAPARVRVDHLLIAGDEVRAVERR